MENIMPMNTHYEQIWREVLHLHHIPIFLALKEDVMVPELGRWCKFHRVKEHHIEDCYQLKKEIERLIQEGNLKKCVKGNSSHVSHKPNLHGREGM